MFSCDVNTFLRLLHHNQYSAECHVHVLHHFVREKKAMPRQGKQVNSVAESLISNSRECSSIQDVFW